MKVFTSQYKYKGKNRFDITVKSGDKTFAPTWEMVMGYKKGAPYCDQCFELWQDGILEIMEEKCIEIASIFVISWLEHRRGRIKISHRLGLELK